MIFFPPFEAEQMRKVFCVRGLCVMYRGWFNYAETEQGTWGVIQASCGDHYQCVLGGTTRERSIG